MRAPPNLLSLVEDGLIEAVLRPLQSGKEAQVYLVVSAGEERVAKVYKEATDRNFKNRSEYSEGRGTRNTRDQRAMQRKSSYGRSRDEDAWRSTEVEMLHRLRRAGVRVPVPHLFSDGVLIMELVQGADGAPARRLGDLPHSPEQAAKIHEALLRDVVRMLCAGIVHGDLSEFNVLLGADGPVIIDLPQAVDASSNRNARQILLRDVGNIERFISRWVPGRKRQSFGEEMWALYEANELAPDTELTGIFLGSQGKADTGAVLDLIADAEEDERWRRVERGQGALPPRRAPRVVFNTNKPRKKESARPATQPARSSPPPPPPPAPPAPRLSLNELIARATAPPPPRPPAPATKPKPMPPPRPAGRPSRAPARHQAGNPAGNPAGRRGQGAAGKPAPATEGPQRSQHRHAPAGPSPEAPRRPSRRRRSRGAAGPAADSGRPAGPEGSSRRTGAPEQRAPNPPANREGGEGSQRPGSDDGTGKRRRRRRPQGDGGGDPSR